MAEAKSKTPSAVTRTLGPVADLEHHLPPEWWRSLFGPIYLKTDGDVVEDVAMTRKEVDEIVAMLGLSPKARVLDLCCGQGRHSIELARRGFGGVVGIDRSRYLIRLARRRARKENLSLRFHEGDARLVGSRRERFDAVLVLGNSFGYFDKLDDDLAILKGIHHILNPGGQILLDVADGAWLRSNFEKRSWEWIDDCQFVCRERSLTRDQTRLISREVIAHSEKGVIVDQFYAERLYDLEGICELLARAGFEGIEMVDQFHTESERDQDLGMMANRIRVKALTPAAAAPTVSFTTGPKCVVLLGDPRLEDDVKLKGKFSPEDIDTVNQLKDALLALKSMKFEFLDDHSLAFEALKRERPDLVFNLCDEGFHNDPNMELHVPAYLEMLDIPYTGSGPACLGLCYDKNLVRALAMQLDIPVPVETSISSGDGSATLPNVFPALLKPSRGDSSVGITVRSVVTTPQQALEAYTELAKKFPNNAILVQELLTGPEYSVGVIGNPGHGYHVLPPLEVDYSELPPELPRILGYESKWDPDSPYWTRIRYIPAQGDDQAMGDMVAQSLKLFDRLGCRDYARFDFRADAEGCIKFLEVNPNPGWCWDGKLNLMAGFEDTSYPELLQLILDAAMQRIGASSAD